MAHAGPKVSLADVAARLLEQPLPSSSGGAPILARRSSAVRQIDDAKREEREAAAISRAKRSLATQAHTTLRTGADASSAVLERQLKKIATRGVVQLFNAVRAAQKEAPEAAPTKAKRKRRDPGAATAPPAAAPLDLSRDSFLDILRRGTGGAKAGAPSSSAAFLRDDFMLGESKSKHWGSSQHSRSSQLASDDAAMGCSSVCRSACLLSPLSPSEAPNSLG
ncbi:hypothetical protein EMIHUDRAFT_452681 [Emiliania huxleyi CCMP1516]|uniref:RRP15-like protein n=2 Tax=Emiliania huxleyi TaxID=2903 RepID=A0A0D3IGU2_EMIH1|nr:hypothetical protein EMIHUDRAFT_452681 [Emiliania huxleyi CCMP1516]EOD10477.1 hypothetical protein EMIHUDRAFT_452681 [Emiliania huxleyi CCMP1516]|eukprot:XP_005762906.1 hypothetical protein EMIHUDRAFT_452681 [Emiliania huxleyi CCMP1516]